MFVEKFEVSVSANKKIAWSKSDALKQRLIALEQDSEE